MTYIPKDGHRRWAWVSTSHQGALGSLERPGGLWAPWTTFGDHLLVYNVIYPRKNKEGILGKERRRLEAELGQEHFCSPAERFH